MITHTQHTKQGFKEAMQNTPTFIKIGNKEFQKLYFKTKTFDEFYESYRQACRYGVDYLKDKPYLRSRDVAIISEVIES